MGHTTLVADRLVETVLSLTGFEHNGLLLVISVCHLRAGMSKSANIAIPFGRFCQGFSRY